VPSTKGLASPIANEREILRPKRLTVSLGPGRAAWADVNRARTVEAGGACALFGARSHRSIPPESTWRPGWAVICGFARLTTGEPMP
jgi:hypothetical protein